MTKTEDQKPKAPSAILLAAGQSRRMGAFKPLLPFGSTTVMRSCIDNLQAAGVGEVVVVVGHRAREVEASLAGVSNLTFALNSESESEMITSLLCGLSRISHPVNAVLVALTDQPGIPALVIEGIIAAWQQGAQLVVPQFEGHGGHPVLIDMKFREELLTLAPDSTLRSFFAAHRDEILRLTVDSPYIARDLDTWEDYRALHEEVFGVLPAEAEREVPSKSPTTDPTKESD